MTPARLAELRALLEARRAAALARLEGLVAEDRRLADRMAELATPPDLDAAAGPADYANLQRQLVWIGHGLAALQRRRTVLAREIAAARTGAARSVGKHAALDRLHELAARGAADARRARVEREAPPYPGPDEPERG